MKSRYRATQRRAQVEEILRLHETGAGTLTKLASDTGVPLSTLAYWRRRIRATSEESRVPDALPRTSRSEFVELSVSHEVTESPCERYVLRLGDIHLEVPRGFDPVEVQDLIRICTHRC